MDRGTFAALVAAGAAVAAATAGGAGAAGAAPAPQQVTAVLSADQVVPAPGTRIPGETGTFTATFDGRIVRYTLTWKGLSGQAAAAQIRFGARKHAGPIAQPLCVPCIAPETGVVPLTAAQITALKAGRLYVSIATAADPLGEVRGQLVLGK